MEDWAVERSERRVVSSEVVESERVVCIQGGKRAKSRRLSALIAADLFRPRARGEVNDLRRSLSPPSVL
jgi:hypothetical protein